MKTTNKKEEIINKIKEIEILEYKKFYNKELDKLYTMLLTFEGEKI
jgi:hypothetical protein